MLRRTIIGLIFTTDNKPPLLVSECTPEPTLLCSAKEHYEKDTGLKNRVQEMLWNTGDLKGLAEWGNKHATGLLPFGVIGPENLRDRSTDTTP